MTSFDLGCCESGTLRGISRRSLLVGARPEEITLLPAGQGHLPGKIEVVERLGSDTYAYVAADKVGALTVRIVGNAADMAVGQTVGLVFNPARLHLFDGNDKVVRA